MTATSSHLTLCCLLVKKQLPDVTSTKAIMYHIKYLKKCQLVGLA